MVPRLSAPQSLSEWRIFALGVIILYITVFFLFERDPIQAVFMGTFTALFSILTAAIIVFAWRGVRETVAE